MNRIDINSLATIVFDVSWQSAQAAHREKYLARRVNMWRDIFFPGMKEALLRQSQDPRVTLSYAPGEAVPPRSETDLKKSPVNRFVSRSFLDAPVLPFQGRFYPRGMLGGHLFFPQDMRPCRITDKSDSMLEVDLAHPLADYPLSVTARVENSCPNNCETGGRLSHWAEEILDTGPGMQARWRGQPTDFAGAGFARMDESQDFKFYSTPRMIHHVDAQARVFLEAEYRQALASGMKVLDLMAGPYSHLPDDMDLQVDGLGLNQEELKANPQLDSHLIHDLNLEPALPYEDSAFDAVVCSMSVEYLTSPYAVIQDAARVLKPGGRLLLAVSDRWFPPKATRLWKELHTFERLGFMLDLMMSTQELGHLETLSIRNWWRPEDDPHTGQTWISDPIFLTSGVKST